MKRGLVLEGGAMRGLFTAGVLDAFLEEELTFDVCVAVSAGAAFGCNLKSKQKGRVLRYNTTYCRDRRYCSVQNLLTTGDLYGADFCYRLLPDELDPFDYETYREDPMDFYAVCTDADTATPVYARCNALTKEEFLYLQASASMPLVSRPVEVGGKRLLDGGVSDSIPLAFLSSLAEECRVLVLTQPKGYRKKPIGNELFFRLALHKTPRLADALLSRHEHYNRSLEEVETLEKAGEIFVIRPPKPIEVKTVERSRARLSAAHETGLSTARAQMDDLKAYLKEKSRKIF